MSKNMLAEVLSLAEKNCVTISFSYDRPYRYYKITVRKGACEIARYFWPGNGTSENDPFIFNLINLMITELDRKERDK